MLETKFIELREESAVMSVRSHVGAARAGDPGPLAIAAVASSRSRILVLSSAQLAPPAGIPLTPTSAKGMRSCGRRRWWHKRGRERCNQVRS